MRKLLFITCILSIVLCMGQRTTRKGLKRNVNKPNTEQTYDTVRVADANADLIDALACSGYEKTLRSRKESFLVTNNSNDTINGINFTIDYYDMQKRQVHQRNLSQHLVLPPGQTRMVEFKSWDAQQVWYYYLSDKPRTRNQATPYKVKISINYFLR